MKSLTLGGMLLAAVIHMASCSQLPAPTQVAFQGKGASGAKIHANPTSGLTTTEGGGVATFTIVLATKPTADVTVTLASNNTAEGQLRQTAGSCTTAGTANTTSCTLTFTPANYLNTQSVNVIGQNDNSDDGDVGYTISASATSSDTDYIISSSILVSVTNTDNDTAGFTATPALGLVTKDDGSTATAQIRLSTQPSANVVFNLESDNTNAGTITTPASKQFTFTTANWNTNQSLTITGGSTLATYKITLNGSVTSTDPGYSAITGTVLSTGIAVQNVAAGDRFIFLTSSAYTGNLGGASGADTKCNAAGNKPNGGTYKAILAGGGRTACTTANCGGGPGEHTDWALLPNQKYIQTGGATIGTTTANAIFTFPLTNAFDTSSNSPWTGLTTTWLTGSNCSNWASTSGNGVAGLSNSASSTTLDAGFGGGTGLSCASLYRIYCAEQ